MTIISPGRTSLTLWNPMGPKAQSSEATHHSSPSSELLLPSTSGLQQHVIQLLNIVRKWVVRFLGCTKAVLFSKYHPFCSVDLNPETHPDMLALEFWLPCHNRYMSSPSVRYAQLWVAPFMACASSSLCVLENDNRSLDSRPKCCWLRQHDYTKLML